MNRKMIEDSKMVAKLTDKCMSLVHNFMNEVSLLSMENDIRKKYEARLRQPMSPEGMSDPENMCFRRTQLQKAQSQLQRIQTFKELLYAGKLVCDLDLDVHPNYLVVMGNQMYLDDGSSFNDLHPLAKSQVVALLNTLELFVKPDYMQTYPENFDFGTLVLDEEPAAENKAECCGDCHSCAESQILEFLSNMGIDTSRVEVVEVGRII